MSNIEIERKQKIYEEIIQEAKESDSTKQPNEFSANDFAKDANIGRDYAVKILEEKVAAGILRARKTKRGIYYSVI
jgi:hypothetical protein